MHYTNQRPKEGAVLGRETRRWGCLVADPFAFCVMAGAGLSGQVRNKSSPSSMSQAIYRGGPLPNAHEGAAWTSCGPGICRWRGRQTFWRVTTSERWVRGTTWPWRWMKTRHAFPITSAKMVGCFPFVDSCLFLVFSWGKALRGLKGTRGRGKERSRKCPNS